MGKELKDDPVYQDLLARGLVKAPSEAEDRKEIPKEAKRSVLIFAFTIVGVVFYATAISGRSGEKTTSICRGIGLNIIC